MKTPTYRVLFSKEAKKNIEKLDPSTVKFVRKAIESLSANPTRGKPLACDLAGLRSLRTSDYRVIYRLKERELLVIVVAVGHRKEIYKKLKEWLSGLSG